VGGALFLAAAAVPFFGDGVSFAVAALLVALMPARHGSAPARRTAAVRCGRMW
jgi:hypothetical protein